MRIPYVQKIQDYFNALIAQGELYPGDKLPSYSEITQKFNIAYATAERAYRKLEAQGTIKIVNGVGSFLVGGELLDVDFYLPSTSFDFTEFQKLADGISQRNHLNLKIHLYNTSGRNVFDFTGNQHKIILKDYNPSVYVYGSQIDFSAFDDYQALMDELHQPDPLRVNNVRLPFFMIGYQGAVNPLLLQRIGFTRTISEFSTFDWWDELVHHCRLSKVYPALKSYSTNHLASFPPLPFMEILLANALHRVPDFCDVPCFDTLTGQRVFHILRDCGRSLNNSLTFQKGNSVLEPLIGSWVTTQYHREPHMSSDSFRIVPVKCGGENMLVSVVECLEAYGNHTVTDAEKKRVWIFLKELLSKPVQQKLMGMSGMISLRKDMSPTDHAWATRDDFQYFFPEKNKLMMSGTIMMELYAVLATLYEQYDLYGADEEAVRKLMDQKIAIFNRMQQN